MKLNPKSWYVWLYRSSYNLGTRELPNNLCPFFWKLVASIIMLPLSWIGHLFNIGDINCNAIDSGSGVSAFIVISGLVIAAQDNIKHFTFNLVFKYYALGILALVLIAIALGIVAGVMWVIGAIYEYIRDKWQNRPYTYKEKQPSIITTFIKAKYNKYCPKIEWTK